MNQMYFCLNNKFYSQTTTKQFANRAFRYGDGVFETIRIINGQPKYLSFHLERLRKGLEALQIEATTTNFTQLEICLNQLLIKNEIEAGGLVRIIAYREGGGRYTPHSNEVAFYLECERLNETTYALNKKGILIGISEKVTIDFHQLSSHKTLNALPYILASKEKEESKFDELILLNSLGNVAEATNSNIFLVIGNQLYTPSKKDGCVEGVMKRVIINKAIQANIKVEERHIKLEELQKADEIFLTNSVNGISWVGGYNSKRYFKKIAEQLIKLI